MPYHVLKIIAFKTYMAHNKLQRERLYIIFYFGNVYNVSAFGGKGPIKIIIIIIIKQSTTN